MAKFAVVMVAVVAKKLRIKFAGTGNAKSIGADLEDPEVVGVVLSNGNFSVEVGMRPVGITTKTVTARNVNAMFVIAIFFGHPEVRNALKLGKFTLN